MSAALDGFKVVDLCTGAAGALSSLLLSEHGARVVRVIGPDSEEFRAGGFVVWDRGKECVRLDLAAAAAAHDSDTPARTALAALIQGADVLLHDFAPASPWRSLLEPAWLHGLQPGLVRGALTAYGECGRWKNEPAIDDLVLARTGVLGGLPGFRPPPVHLVHPLPSIAAGVLMALGLTAALYARERDGQGRQVETSLMAGALLFHPKVHAEHLARHVFQTHPAGSAPFYSVYRCADERWVQLGCVSQKFIDRAGAVLGLTQTLGEARFGQGREPVTPEADTELRALLAEVIAGRDFSDWAEAFEAADVPFAEARWTEDSLDDPQILHNQMVVELDDPELGPVKQMGVGLTMSQTPGAIRGPRRAAGALNQIPCDWQPVTRYAVNTRPGRPSLPLAGVRVLEITNLIAGPTTGRLLAELGADVVKLEPPSGDLARPIGRSYFYSVNFNKRSLCIDTSSPQGKLAVQRVAAQSDVLVANLRPAATERMGITFERCPKLIQTHLTGYGWTGPYARRPGIDPLAQALMGLSRAQGGAANAPVFPAQLAPTDFTTGAVGAFGSVLGLLARARYGVVQRVESNLLNGGILLGSEWFCAHAKRRPRPLGDREQYGLSAYHRLYRVADGWIYLAADVPSMRRALCKLADIAGDSVLGDDAAGAHPCEAAPAGVLSRWFAPLSRAECLELLAGAGIWAAPAEPGDAEVFLYDEHALSASVVVDRRHPKLGKMRVVWRYVAVRGAPESAGLPTPILGQHTAAVLAEAGFTAAEIAELTADGIVVGAQG